MKRFLISVGLVCAAGMSLALPGPAFRQALAHAADDKAEANKKELAALQGTWKLVFHEEEGKEVAYDTPQLYTINDQKITVKRNGEVLVEGDLKLNATAKPMHLDFEFTSGQTDLTIFTRVGGYLIQCGRRDGKTRPKEFASGTDDGGPYVIVLKREK